jgi:hypothetical protein
VILRRTVEFETPRAPGEAFGFVAERYFENHARWDPAIVEMAKLSAGPIGVGTKGRETRRFGGKQVADFEVTDYEPGRRFAFSNTSGMFRLDRAYSFQPADGGTRVSFSLVMEPTAAMAKIMFPVLHGLVDRHVRKNLSRLKGLLAEAGAR